MLNQYKKSPAQANIIGRIFFLARSEEHTSELQSHLNLVCRLLLEKKKYRITASPQLRQLRRLELHDRPERPHVRLRIRCTPADQPGASGPDVRDRGAPTVLHHPAL